MKRLFSVTLTLVAVLGLAALPVAAQSLTEAAAKEKERRKGKAAKTYTEDDLRGGPRLQTSEAEPAPGASPKPGASPAAAEDEATKRQKAWRESLDNANKEVAHYTSEAQRLQLALNDNTVDMYSPGRLQAQQSLEEAKQKLAEAQKQVADLQEEARRNRWR
jgi:chromosome segregation ATPase